MPYNFSIEDYSQFTEDVLKAEGDQATLTTLLADMQGTITDAIAKDTANTESVNRVTAENERLKKANMDLFLRVGSSAIDQQNKAKETEAAEAAKTLTTSDYMKSYFDKLDGGK